MFDDLVLRAEPISLLFAGQQIVLYICVDVVAAADLGFGLVSFIKRLINGFCELVHREVDHLVAAAAFGGRPVCFSIHRTGHADYLKQQEPNYISLKTFLGIDGGCLFRQLLLRDLEVFHGGGDVVVPEEPGDFGQIHGA